MGINIKILQIGTFLIAIFTALMLIGFDSVYASNCGINCGNKPPDGVWWKGCCVSSGTKCCSSEGSCKLIPCDGCPPSGGSGGGGGYTPPPPPPCERCTLPACPVPLQDSGDEDYKLLNFLKCTDVGGCTRPIDHYKSCYEVPSDPPTAKLIIKPDGVQNKYGFTSMTHTGDFLLSDGVNEPIEMLATYTDSDSGSSSIEAMYVWLSQGGIPDTPNLLSSDTSLKGVVNSLSEFGFMMRRVSGNWVPYIVHDGITDYWVSTEYNDKTFYIKGPNSENIVWVDILNITEYSNEDRIELSFSLSFTANPEYPQKVNDGFYYAYVMANDTFGFTPYDNYDAYPEIKSKIPNYFEPNEIRYYEDWVYNDGENDGVNEIDWIVDLTAPTIGASVKVVNPYTLRLKWNISDNMNIKYLVGNMYLSDSYNTDFQVEPFVISVTSDKTITSEATYTPHTFVDGDIIGHLNDDHIFRLEGSGTPWSSSDTSEYVDIDVGKNRHGVINLYLTAFDLAGNPVVISGDGSGDGPLDIDLRDWYATKGGLFFSDQGIDFSPKVIEGEAITLWDPITFILGITPQEADVSTELVGFGSAQSASAPLKSLYTNSYMVYPFKGDSIKSYYDYFTDAYNRRRDLLIKNNTITEKTTFDSTYSLSDKPTVFLIEGDLSLSNNYECNGQAIFLVGGNLNITTELKNNNPNKDACIFVVKESVTVGDLGVHSYYDSMNAYIFTDKQFIVEGEEDEGLYIGGGVHALGGFNLKRYLTLENRLISPVVGVTLNSKYGVLAGKVFGSPLEIQKIEVGMKPY